MIADKSLPCPFCGCSNPWPLERYAGAWAVLCGQCSAEGALRSTPAEAVAAWNQRKSPAPQPFKLDLYLQEVLQEAAKTRATAAVLPDGSPMFINYGNQPEDTAHLDCPACGGSGHVGDAKLPSFPELTEVQQVAIKDAVAAELGEAMDCGRVWHAWSAGTMSEDDFHRVADDYSRLHDITMAGVNAYVKVLVATKAGV